MRAFTLIEILVVITLFAITITAFFGLFSSAFRYQQKSLDKTSLLNNASYITEYMSRALRLAKKDKQGQCIDENHNFEVNASQNGIKFLNFHGDCQEFSTTSTHLRVGKDLGSGYQYHNLTPADVLVENLKFYVTGEPQPPDDKNQPRVTIVLELKKGDQVLPLQTTITQRQLDVKY